MTFEKDILTVTEASYYLACSPQKIYDLIHMGSLEAYKDEGRAGRRGRAWKITAFSVEYYLRSRLNKCGSQKSCAFIEQK